VLSVLRTIKDFGILLAPLAVIKVTQEMAGVAFVRFREERWIHAAMPFCPVVLSIFSEFSK